MPYIDSAATGANDGTSKLNAYVSAITAAAAHTPGDVFLMAHTHYENTSGLHLNPVGTSRVNPFILRSIDFSTDLMRRAPAVQLDGITTTVDIHGEVRIYGVSIKASAGIFLRPGGLTLGNLSRFYDCRLENINEMHRYNECSQELIDCELVLSNAFMQRKNGGFKMIGGSVSGSVNTARGLIDYRDSGVDPEFHRVDLSGLTNGPLGRDYRAGVHAKPVFIDCKMPSLATSAYWYSPPSGSDSFMDVVNSKNAGGKNTITRVYADDRILETDTGVYLDAGFEEFDSGTKQSFKVTPIANTTPDNPLTCFPVSGFAETTGTKTLILEFVHDYTTAVLEGQFYAVVGAMETSGSSFRGSVSSANAVTDIRHDKVTMGAALATSTSAWTGASGLTKQKIEIPITINEVGEFKAEIYFGLYEAGKVFYYNPEFEVV